MVRGEQENKGREVNLPMQTTTSPEKKEPFAARASPFQKALTKNQSHQDLRFEDIASTGSPIKVQEGVSGVSLLPPKPVIYGST